MRKILKKFLRGDWEAFEGCFTFFSAGAESWLVTSATESTRSIFQHGRGKSSLVD